MSDQQELREQVNVGEQVNIDEQGGIGEQGFEMNGFAAAYGNGFGFGQGGDRAFYGDYYNYNPSLAALLAITPYLIQPYYAPYYYPYYSYGYPYYSPYGYGYGYR